MLVECDMNRIMDQKRGKLLVCDFDRTFYRQDGAFAENLAASQRWQDSGNMFVVVTGRNLSRLEEVFPDWKGKVDFLITDNGGAVFDRYGSLKLFGYFANGEIDKMLWLVGSDALPVYYYMDFFSTEILPYEVPLKIRLWYHDAGRLWEHKRRLEGEVRVKVLPHPEPDVTPETGSGKFAGFLDVVPNDSGKEGALAKLCEVLKYEREEVIAVGDDLNDLEMLSRFPSYAMADGKPEAIAAAQGRMTKSVAKLIDGLL